MFVIQSFAFYCRVSRYWRTDLEERILNRKEMKIIGVGEMVRDVNTQCTIK